MSIESPPKIERTASATSDLQKLLDKPDADLKAATEQLKNASVADMDDTLEHAMLQKHADEYKAKGNVEMHACYQMLATAKKQTMEGSPPKEGAGVEALVAMQVHVRDQVEQRLAQLKLERKKKAAAAHMERKMEARAKQKALEDENRKRKHYKLKALADDLLPKKKKVAFSDEVKIFASRFIEMVKFNGYFYRIEYHDDDERSLVLAEMCRHTSVVSSTNGKWSFNRVGTIDAITKQEARANNL